MTIGGAIRNLFVFLGALLCVFAVQSAAFGQSAPITVNQDGATLNNPVVQCAASPPRGAPTPVTRGITVNANNVTINNPTVRNCQFGVYGDRISGLTVQGSQTLMQGNRVQFQLPHASDVYIGVPNDGADDGVSGFNLRDMYRIYQGSQGSDVLIEDIDARCGTNVWGSGAPQGGCHNGIALLSDRSSGAPYISENFEVRNSYIQDVDDEGVGVDGHVDVRADASVIGTDVVTAKTANSVTLQSNWGIPENLSGQALTVVDGPAQGAFARITADPAGSVFQVADPRHNFNELRVGDRVSVGMAYDDFRYLSNTIENTGGKVHANFHAATNYGQIRNNTFIGRNDFIYRNEFNTRDTDQCINLRTWSIAPGVRGGTTIALASKHSITGNTCQFGDISRVVVTFNQPHAGFEVASYNANNTLGAGYQQHDFRYSQMAQDPNAPAPPPDGDGDGVPDASDNCVDVSNANQADLDSDGAGDACDSQDNRDSDGDGFENFEDACPDVAGVFPSGCPAAPASVTREAESMTLANGATLTGGGDSVRFDANGERANWNDVGAGHDSVTITGRHNGAGNSRVCIELRLNGAIVGTTRCYAPTDNVYQERTWALPAPLSATDDLSFFSREVTAPEVFFFDKARAE